jgi:hypothetical protein
VEFDGARNDAVEVQRQGARKQPGWAGGTPVLLCAYPLILTPPYINISNLHILAGFCQYVSFYNLLIPSKINMSLEFDTVGRSRLLYHGNGVALKGSISAAKPTLRGG